MASCPRHGWTGGRNQAVRNSGFDRGRAGHGWLGAPGASGGRRSGQGGGADPASERAPAARRERPGVPSLRPGLRDSRTPRTAAQLALSELSLGYWLAAHDHLTEALTSVTNHPWITDNRATLEAQLAVADSHLAEITIEGKPEGANVVINRKRIGALPLPGAIKVDEGRIDIEIRIAGYEPVTRTLTLSGRAHERIFVTLVPAAPTTAPSAPAATATQPPRREERDDVPAWRRVLPWTLLAAGVAGLGVGIWQHLTWRQSQSDFEAIAACGEDLLNRGADPRCRGLFEDLDGHRTSTFIAYGAAGVLAAAATTIFIINAQSTSGGAAPSVAVTPGGLYASLRVPF
jgi:hypothetical protein